MESKIIAFRASKDMVREMDRLATAAGLSPGEWVRALVAKATGVTAEMPRGLAKVSKRRRTAISRAGGEAKAAAKGDWS